MKAKFFANKKKTKYIVYYITLRYVSLRLLMNINDFFLSPIFLSLE